MSEVPLKTTTTKDAFHTVGENSCIKSQLAAHNQIQGLVWCKFSHAVVTFPLRIEGNETLVGNRRRPEMRAQGAAMKNRKGGWYKSFS